jgi:diaminopimelate epimerase
VRFYKYHALGNDYLVLNPADFPAWTPAPTAEQIRVVCHRNFGIGSDGILWGPLPAEGADTFGLRIFNPDGSEAEKSGNGLRIFSRYLRDAGLAPRPTFDLLPPGGRVQVEIRPDGLITIAMGQVSFDSARIPVTGPKREVLNESITVGGRTFTYCAATIGNPHCVLPLPEISADLAKRYGPELEVHPNFPRKTNVQFLQVLDRANIRIEIWERGAGYTLASGSSSSAAAAVARRLGLVDPEVTVHMPGGQLEIEIGPDFAIQMTGPVTRVGEGTLDPELFQVRV